MNEPTDPKPFVNFEQQVSVAKIDLRQMKSVMDQYGASIQSFTESVQDLDSEQDVTGAEELLADVDIIVQSASNATKRSWDSINACVPKTEAETEAKNALLTEHKSIARAGHALIMEKLMPAKTMLAEAKKRIAEESSD